MIEEALSMRAHLPPRFTRWQALRNARIALTGARGTLGSLMVERLAENGIETHAFGGDITDPVAINAWLAKTTPRLVLHFASVVPVDRVQLDPMQAMRVNAVGCLELVAAMAANAPGAWLFHASSSHVYRPLPVVPCGQERLSESAPCVPSSLYGATKLAAECLVLPTAASLGINACIGRIFSFHHPCQAETYLVPGLIRRIAQAQKGSVLEVAYSNSVRDFLPAQAVIDAILHLAAARFSGVVNIGSGTGVSVMEVAQHCLRASEKDVELLGIPSPCPTALVADVGLLRSVLKAASA